MHLSHQPCCQCAESLFSCGILTLTIKNPDSVTPTPTLGLIVSHNDCALKNDLQEILNYSNKRCTKVYKQIFSCKINCTKVKQTATKLHKSPDQTYNAESWSLASNDETPTAGQNPAPGDSTTLLVTDKTTSLVATQLASCLKFAK